MSLMVMLMALSCASRECNASWVEDPAHLLLTFYFFGILFLKEISICDLCFAFLCLNGSSAVGVVSCLIFWVTLALVIAQHFYWKLPKFEFVAANVYEFVLKHFLYKFGVF